MKKELIMYVIFGAGTTVVNWIIYSALVLFNINMTIANLIAWLGAVTFAFITNKLFVFESRSLEKTVILKEAFAFFGSRILTGVIEIAGPTLLFHLGIQLSMFGIKGFGAKLLISVIVIILNYILSKSAVFTDRRK